MNGENNDGNRDEEACAGVKLVTAKEALKREVRRIEVPENSVLLLSPANLDYESFFSRVRLKLYEDLQTLGFVPRRLTEDKVRQAMAADDDEVYKLAGRLLRQPVQGCGCSKQNTHVEMPRVSQVRTIYNSMRKKHNPALANVLSDHYGTHISWDSSVAAIVRKWVEFLSLNKEILLLFLDDIIINRNATLTVVANAKSLLAHNIWIHKTGRLVNQGSYLKIWANSINRFNDFLSPVTVEVARKVTPIWLLTE